MKYIKKPIVVEAYQTAEELEIETLEGTMKADVGDFIITGIKGEQYPCKPDVFEETYDEYFENIQKCEVVEVEEKEMSTLQLKLNEMNLELYEQQKLCKVLQEELENYKQLLKRVNLELQEITGLLQNRERLVKLIAGAESVSKDVSVREVLRDEIKGLDTVAETSYNAFNDYVLLSTFYEKMYGESVWGDE